MTKPFILTVGSTGPLTDIKSRRRAMTLSRSKLYRDARARRLRIKKRSAVHLFQPRPFGVLRNLPEKYRPDGLGIDRVYEAFNALNLPEGVPVEQQILELEVLMKKRGSNR